MGGQGSGRKPDWTKRALAEMKTPVGATNSGTTGDLFLPNVSGMSSHPEFKKALQSYISLGDISGNSPITYNSSTGEIGFDFSTDNSWTGTNEISVDSTLAFTVTDGATDIFNVDTTNEVVELFGSPTTHNMLLYCGGSSSSKQIGVNVSPTLSDTSSAALYGMLVLPSFSGIPTGAKTFYGLNFQANHQVGDNGQALNLYSIYGNSAVLGIGTTYSADDTLVGVAGNVSWVPIFGYTFSGNFIGIGGYFPEVSFGGTHTGSNLGLSVAMGGDSLIASNKKLYFEGNVSTVVAPQNTTIGDSYMTYSSTLAELQFVVNGTEIIAAKNNALGFYNTTPTTQQTITGSKGGNTALGNLLTALANLGLIVDSTT